MTNQDDSSNSTINKKIDDVEGASEEVEARETSVSKKLKQGQTAQIGIDEAQEKKLFGVSKWRWEALSSLFAIIGFFSVILAGIWGIYEYTQRVEADKARETLVLIEVWETKGAKDSYNLLASKVSQLLGSLDIPQDMPEGEKIKNINSKVDQIIMREKVSENAFEEVVYFFNRLALCVEAELCSIKIAKVFYEDTLSSFLVYFENSIKKGQQNRIGYGQSVLDLARQIKSNS